MNPQVEVTEFQQKQQNAIYEFLRVCTDIGYKFKPLQFAKTFLILSMYSNPIFKV